MVLPCARPPDLTVSVIIVNWNVSDLLADCLRSVYAQMAMPAASWEVLVVDNASSDGSAEMVRREFPGVTLIANTENGGFGRANNQAFRISGGRFVLLLNPDTVVLDHALDRMVEYMQVHQEVGALGCRLVNPDGSFQRWTGGNSPTMGNVLCHFLFSYKLLPAAILPPPLYLEREPHEDTDVGWVSGACMLLRREALGAQIFDERYFMYGEDVDLCNRMHDDGWKVVYTPRAAIVHCDGRSLDRQAFEFQYHKLRSLRRLFADRNAQALLPLYDAVVVFGFAVRALAYALASVVQPGRGHATRATKSRRLMGEALRMLARGES